MKIYVVTSDGMTVATFDNDLSGALKYFDDEFHRYLDTGASTFDLSVAKRFQMYSNGSKGTEDDFQYLKENNYLVFTYKNQDFKFKIRRIEETETSLRLFCDNLSLDLINEYRGPATYNKAYKLAKYINDVIVDSGYQIGTNEFLSNERTLRWDGDQTVLARILSIANSFGAEVEFETILNDDRTTKQNLINFRKRVGMDRQDIELKYGRNVSSISRNVDITELITAIKPRGHEENDVTTTIKNVAKEIKDEDGSVKFYTKKGSEYIYAPQANQIYGQPKFKGGGYIVGQFSYDTKSDTELFNRALAELEKKCLPAYEFEIEGFYDVDIGDTIRAIDEAYNPILMLEARISEQIISFSDPSKNKTVYSNYRILENKVNQSLLDRIEEVKKYAEQVAKTYIFSINNIGSPMFKNGEGEVTFAALIEKNNQDMTGEFTSYNWVKQNKDGTPDEDWNAAHQGVGKSITVKPSDITDTATFSYEALQEGLSIGGASGVVTNVNDGEDGKTPVKGVDYFDGEDGTNGLSSYLHIRYSQNANGNPMTESPTDAKFVGMQASQNPNASTVPSDYRWAEFKGTDGLPGETGSDGKTSYLHIKYSNDGGKTFTGNSGEDAGEYIGQYVDFTQADSNDVKAYIWAEIKGEPGTDGQDGSDGIDGADGVGISSTVVHYQASVSGTEPPNGTWSTTVPNVSASQFLWTRTTITYTNNKNSVSYSVGKMGATGTPGKDGVDGKTGADGKPGSNGVSVSSVVEEYYVSTSPNSQAGGSWTTTVPNNANPNLYVFRRMKTTMSNGTVTYTSPALIQGMTGIYPYIGPTQPANPKEGQQWWKSDASGNVTNFYVYKSGSWQGQTIQQSILNIVALNAVTITGSNIVGTVINGSEFVNAGSFTDASSVIEYLTTIKGPIQMEYNVKDTTQNGTFIINPRTIVNSLYKDIARNLLQSQWSIGSGGFSVTEGNAEEKNRKNTAVSANGIFMEDATMTYGKVSLAYQDLMSVPATLIPANSGFSQYQTTGNSTPLVSRQGRLVQLSGAFKNNAEIASGGSGTMGTLPIWARPERNVLARVQGSGNNTYLLTVEPSGLIKMGRYAAGASNTAVVAGSWLNIAITFAAKNI